MGVNRWPYDQPHTSYSRYGVRLASGLLLKGMARDDALDMHDDAPGGDKAMRQVVVYVTGGPDEGHEVLGPWKLVVPD